MLSDKSLKILYLVKSSTPYGSNVALVNLLDEIKQYKVEPLVIYCNNGPLIEWLKEKDIPNRRVANFSYQVYPPKKTIKNLIAYLPRLILLPFRNIRAYLELKSIVKEFRPDLIHTNVGPVHVGFKVAKALRIPHVWHIREYQDLDFKMQPFPSMANFRNKIKNSSLISISTDLFKYFGMSENAKVIYDGVLHKDVIRFLPQKEKYFLFVGRVNEGKNVKIVVESFIEFSKKNKDFELHIAGTGPQHYIKELNKIIAQHSLQERIKFLGFRSDRYDLMAHATATVVPSLKEGFGFITVEAIFNGCLVIGLNSGGTKEILEKNNLGLLFNNKNELTSILNDVAQRGIEEFYPTIFKAQTSGVELYSIEHSTKEVYNYYRAIVGKND